MKGKLPKIWLPQYINILVMVLRYNYDVKNNYFTGILSFFFYVRYAIL